MLDLSTITYPPHPKVSIRWVEYGPPQPTESLESAREPKDRILRSLRCGECADMEWGLRLLAKPRAHPDSPGAASQFANTGDVSVSLALARQQLKLESPLVDQRVLSRNHRCLHAR
jgi:hypothetical protein